MFPLWLLVMHLGMSRGCYLSFGVLGLISLFFAIAILRRVISYIATVIVTLPGIWIFPKLSQTSASQVSHNVFPLFTLYPN